MEEKKFISCTSTDVECGASLLATLTWKWEHSTRQGLVPLYLPVPRRSQSHWEVGVRGGGPRWKTRGPEKQ